MDIFRHHELFEIEVLDRMKSSRSLDPVVFGGGSMLRLCYELKRYSVDLDFWFVKTVPQKDYFNRLQNTLDKDYKITDSQMKHYIILIELRAPSYPRRLKIEIRRKMKECDFQEMIAFSKFGTTQVLLKAHTLEQTMKNKIKAFLDRGEIRDCFDIEFLLRNGVELPDFSSEQLYKLQKKVTNFKDRDFKVKLGSILEEDIRNYYIVQRFSYLEGKLNSLQPEP